MRLIDADAIPYTMLYKENWLAGTGMEKQGAWKDDIEAMPTIEERKGKWIQDPKSKRYRCDQCFSFALRTDDRMENLSDFCPVCGAYMEEQP